MSARATRLVAWSLWAVGILLVGMHLVFLAVNDVPGRDWAARASESGIIVLGLTFGALIAARHPENAIGWLFFVAPFIGISWGIAGQYANRALVADPGSLPAGEFAAWLQGWIRWLTLLPCMLGLLLFPTGRLISRRWTLVAWSAIPGVTGIALAHAISPGRLAGITPVENPYGIEGPAPAILLGVAYAFTLLFLVPATSLSQVVRFRRAGPAERLQIKWVAFGGAFFATAFALFSVVTFFAPVAADRPLVAETLPLLGISGLVLATGTAILRHRLYDIDVIINRTLVYGGLTLTTVGSYLAMVFGLGWLARMAMGQGSNELAVAATTLIVAALFQPARRRIQSLVDRRFYRSRYDAAQIVASFQASLRHQMNLDTLTSELARAAGGTMRPAHLSVWLRDAGDKP